MRKYIFLALLAIAIAYCLPSELHKPGSDGILKETYNQRESTIETRQTASFELKDPVPINAQDYARIEWRKHGWSENDWNALVKLWGNESGWEAGRLNTSSHACGIVQSWPCNKVYGYATEDYIQANKVTRNGKQYLPAPDPEIELKWGAQYILDRYKTPSGALAFWYSQCGGPKGCWY